MCVCARTRVCMCKQHGLMWICYSSEINNYVLLVLIEANVIVTLVKYGIGLSSCNFTLVLSLGK